MMKLNLLCHLCLGVLLSGAMVVRGTDLETALVLSFKDGTKMAYHLSARPVLSFKGSVLHVVSGDVTVDYPLDQVWKHTFEEVEASAVTERHAGVGVVRVVGNQVRFSGLPSGQAVSVYSADGRQVACYRVGGDGCGELSLQACPAGLYVIKYGKSTLKIMKR